MNVNAHLMHKARHLTNQSTHFYLLLNHYFISYCIKFNDFFFFITHFHLSPNK